MSPPWRIAFGLVRLVFANHLGGQDYLQHKCSLLSHPVSLRSRAQASAVQDQDSFYAHAENTIASDEEQVPLSAPDGSLDT